MPLLSLIAVTVAVLTEVLRAAGPPLGHLARTAGPTTAVTVIVLACLGGFLAPALRAVAGPRGLLIAGIGGLSPARLALQALPGAAWLAAAGVVVGMLAVAALYEAARGLSGTGFAVATTAGLAGGTALWLAFGTWDPIYRPGVVPWLAGLALAGAAAALLVSRLRAPVAPAPAIGRRDALGAVALGPFLALQILVLASPAFAASSGWPSPAAAGAAVLAGQALALAFLSSGLAVAAVPGGVCVFGGAALGVGVALVTGRHGLTGHVTIAVIVIGQVLAAWLLAVASRVPLRRGGYRGRDAGTPGSAATRPGSGASETGLPAGSPPADVGGRVRRIDLGAAVGGLLIGAVLLPYQLHYEAPLPLPNKVLPGGAGVLLGLLAAVAAARGGPLPARSATRALAAGAGALLLLVVPASYAASAPHTSAPTALPGTFRLVAYDVGRALVADGRLDPESVARTIEAQRADVVALQEVGRGRPDSGGTDVAAWLARRLRMRLVWGPAADRQFGNAVLSRLPVRAAGTARLPVGAGPQARGYVWARLDVGGGRTADVWSVDVQRGANRLRTRLAQIDRLVRAWSGAPHTIIAGDLNAGPSGPERDRLAGQGDLRAAGGDQDGTAAVSVYGTGDVGFDDVSAADDGIADRAGGTAHGGTAHGGATEGGAAEGVATDGGPADGGPARTGGHWAMAATVRVIG